MTPPEEVDVLRLITRLNIGGPARQALLLTRRLEGTHPTLLAAGAAPTSEGEMSDERVPVHRVPLVRPPRPKADLQALLAVRALLRQHRPRILHTHMAKAGTVGRAAASLPGPRPRTVHTFHGHVLEGYFSPPVERAFVELERRLARRTDVLVAVSDEVRDELLDLGIGRSSQYEVIRLGLDLGRHLEVRDAPGRFRASLGLAPGVPLVGAVGRLAPIKNLPLLVDAVATLAGVHLALVGDGPQRGELEEHVRRRPELRGRVHFTGWRHDMPEVLADLDVVALSSNNEGTPVALIEALACARPVVATLVGGVGSVVADGETGRLVPKGDGRALTTAISWSLEHPVEAQAAAAVGRERVRRTFGEDRLVADIRALYDSLGPAGGAGRPASRRVRRAAAKTGPSELPTES